MSASLYFRSFRAARRTICRLVLVVVMLPTLLLSCDSFGTGSSGLSLTSDTQAISPSDSTVTLTLTNDSPSPIYADFLCGLSIERKIDGAWDNGRLVYQVCALFNRVSTSDRMEEKPKLTIGPLPVIPSGGSIDELIRFQRDLSEATAVRFRIQISYRKTSFASLTPLPRKAIQGEINNTVGDIAFYPGDEGFDGRGELVTEEIRITL